MKSFKDCKIEVNLLPKESYIIYPNGDREVLTPVILDEFHIWSNSRSLKVANK